ncbi:hypothetical protein [Streptomyces sp. NPDC098926]|uniref:hypothetical protein n=1 Tax=Streptomyces sp. NPDC098926 TaxID=3366099 RepID=UPI00380877CF
MGGKHHLIADVTGMPLAATLTGGNRDNGTQLTPLLQAALPVRAKHGRPGRRPEWCRPPVDTTTPGTAGWNGTSA